ncbi:Autophagy-related protein 4 F (Atg4F) [Monocercomonoides exilis]|uniref:Autophagy-related protein 4 F (Atg4F) n=1 Tax=Monocercomonoides exilis TaxID=2049356 RepID=UPI003559BF6D|nr:Autophagy-related protein 4 F (Atg4F) [Monocercomonoides exilis]|eukprot:MONOS_5740.1-p1 / transcript=MONOS_5740.1 / gene=MONOS_5740 / organism=Monocercomonoides_exilis_PA203 / gene_product=Autophagy-related protein 4 F (Atg4F) / transcript_product=Autophagy-related protein 4 F (Atg4F) / location=Mono_scaffold00171:85950-89957(-) / protein_length=1336 / sequence_SO=supercontig / SO=protein_coding / is_pseudo=false
MERKVNKNDIWILGNKYSKTTSHLLERAEGNLSPIPHTYQDMLKSRLWITYRKDYQPIIPSKFTSDRGWGCVHRTSQMMFAEALIRLEPYRRSYTGQIDEREILQYFLDTQEAIFSIHNIAQGGMHIGKRIGQWFSPSDSARVFENITSKYNDERFPIIIRAVDCTLIADEILQKMRDAESRRFSQSFVRASDSRKHFKIDEHKASESIQNLAALQPKQNWFRRIFDGTYLDHFLPNIPLLNRIGSPSSSSKEDAQKATEKKLETITIDESDLDEWEDVSNTSCLIIRSSNPTNSKQSFSAEKSLEERNFVEIPPSPSDPPNHFIIKPHKPTPKSKTSSNSPSSSDASQKSHPQSSSSDNHNFFSILSPNKPSKSGAAPTVVSPLDSTQPNIANQIRIAQTPSTILESAMHKQGEKEKVRWKEDELAKGGMRENMKENSLSNGKSDLKYKNINKETKETKGKHANDLRSLLSMKNASNKDASQKIEQDNCLRNDGEKAAYQFQKNREETKKTNENMKTASNISTSNPSSAFQHSPNNSMSSIEFVSCSPSPPSHSQPQNSHCTSTHPSPHSSTECFELVELDVDGGLSKPLGQSFFEGASLCSLNDICLSSPLSHSDSTVKLVSAENKKVVSSQLNENSSDVAADGSSSLVDAKDDDYDIEVDLDEDCVVLSNPLKDEEKEVSNESVHMNSNETSNTVKRETLAASPSLASPSSAIYRGRKEPCGRDKEEDGDRQKKGKNAILNSETESANQSAMNVSMLSTASSASDSSDSSSSSLGSIKLSPPLSPPIDPNAPSTKRRKKRPKVNLLEAATTPFIMSDEISSPAKSPSSHKANSECASPDSSSSRSTPPLPLGFVQTSQNAHNKEEKNASSSLSNALQSPLTQPDESDLNDSCSSLLMSSPLSSPLSPPSSLSDSPSSITTSTSSPSSSTSSSPSSHSSPSSTSSSSPSPPLTVKPKIAPNLLTSFVASATVPVRWIEQQQQKRRSTEETERHNRIDEHSHSNRETGNKSNKSNKNSEEIETNRNNENNKTPSLLSPISRIGFNSPQFSPFSSFVSFNTPPSISDSQHHVKLSSSIRSFYSPQSSCSSSSLCPSSSPSSSSSPPPSSYLLASQSSLSLHTPKSSSSPSPSSSFISSTSSSLRVPASTKCHTEHSSESSLASSFSSSTSSSSSSSSSSSLSSTHYSSSSSSSSSLRPSAVSWTPLIVLIPMRLGLSSVDSSVIPSFLSLFTLPWSLGFVGGKPRRSFWFVGCSSSSLFYLDPHTTQRAAVDARNIPLETFHQNSVKEIDIKNIDPSTMACFLLPTYNDFVEFCSAVQEMNNPLFTIIDHKSSRW